MKTAFGIIAGLGGAVFFAKLFVMLAAPKIEDHSGWALGIGLLMFVAGLLGIFWGGAS